MAPDIASLQDWVGRSVEAEDIVTPRIMASFRATLSPHAADFFGEEIAPLGLHWCLTPDIADAAELGPDGHPARGGFLPPVPLPRRMWAAGDIRFLAPIRGGDTIRRRSTVAAVEEKHGRTGTLVFVTVRHEMRNAAGPVIEEDQTLVYRLAEAAPVPPASPAEAPPDAPHRRTAKVDPVLLFRYSALTFNGHRIHYDRKYVTEVEGYPGLVVHGPLIATLLMDLLRRHAPEADVAAFRFKAVRPTFDLNPFRVNGQVQPDGKTVKLWAQDHEGWLTMDAVATLR
jgi:3-methylfumaryl-CoA hydratase